MEELLRQKILGSIPRIFSLLDKNPYSETFGSFDRKYWQYKIIDFPCGMQQELVLPLAYAWKTNFTGNPYYGQGRIRDYLEGIFLYHGKCMHADGSLDDYFPHERAFGATAYALAALTEASLLTGICPSEVISSFLKSGDFLNSYKEKGRLSNHLAIASLALTNLYLLTGDKKWLAASDAQIARLKELQHKEGWFFEYGGCDLGYQTVTIEFLARRYQKAPDGIISEMLANSLDFLINFIHPDGSLGGEYGSRNTYNFYPGGFAALSGRFSAATKILGCFYKGLKNGACGYLEDDGVFGHLLSSYVTLLSCPKVVTQECLPDNKGTDARMRYFAGAGLFFGVCGKLRVFGSTTKQGVYKVFKEDKLVFSDTGLVGKLRNGQIFCQNKYASPSIEAKEQICRIEGDFYKFSSKRLTRFQMIMLRALSLLFGRFKWYSHIMRMAMQRVLISDRKTVDVRFTRSIELRDNEIIVADEVYPGRGVEISSLQRSTDCVAMHVITSDAFQSANLLEWEGLEVGVERALKYEKRYK